MEIDRREIALQVIVGGLFAVSCFLFFQLLIPYHLFMKEQTQLFFLTAGHFLSYFDKPAWMACYLGDFLTQFFYLRGGGAAVLTVVLLIEWQLFVLVLKRLGLGYQAIGLALIPVVVECFLHCQLSYSLSSSIGIQLVLFVFLLYTYQANRWLSIILGLFFVSFLYYIAGALCFAFPVLVIVYEIRKREIRMVYWLALLLVCGLFPSLVRHSYFLTVDQAYSYPNHALETGRINMTRENIFALASESYFGKWDNVLEQAEDEPLKNRVATYYTNLALSEKNELPDKLLQYYQPASQGLFLAVGPESNWMDIFFSSDVFYHLGDMNMAQHSAMLGMIFSPNHRSSRMVKRLAEINLVLGETEAAQKYLRMLESTLFHRRWARRHSALVGSAEADSLLAYKHAQLSKYELLRNASDNEASLQVLVESNPDNTQAMNYLLCFYLLNKDLPSFVSAYNAYCKGNPLYTSRIYYEALLIMLVREKASKKVLDSYAIPDNITADFMDYTKLFEEHGEDMDVLREKYAGTYWFYYHYAAMEE